jgi:hypothetical protein
LKIDFTEAGKVAMGILSPADQKLCLAERYALTGQVNNELQIRGIA